MRKSQPLTFLTGLLAGLSLAVGAAASAEVDYPQDTVTLVTHSTPGGGSDVFLREMVRHLRKYVNATFIIENVSGGSGARAISRVATAKPDGSVFYATTPTYILTSLLSRPPHSYRDLEPVVNFFTDTEIVYTRADGPYRSLKDVIDRARTARGRCLNESGWKHLGIAPPSGSQGGLFGLGLGQSRAKWGFLPEAHTDFIFSIIGEELGLVGCSVVIVLFLVVVSAGVLAGRRAGDLSSMLVAVGISTWIGLQALFNIGVAVGALPNKGITLPFVSYGGTSLIVTIFAAGILLNIARHPAGAALRDPIRRGSSSRAGAAAKG